MTKIMYAAGTDIAGTLLRGWWLMLGVGIAHAEWISALPTIGYWWACLLAALLCAAFTPYQTTTVVKP